GGLALTWLAARHEEGAGRPLAIEGEHAGPNAAVGFGRRRQLEQAPAGAMASWRTRAEQAGKRWNSPQTGQRRNSTQAGYRRNSTQPGQRRKPRQAGQRGNVPWARETLVVRHDAERRQLEIVAHIVRSLQRAIDVLPRKGERQAEAAAEQQAEGQIERDVGLGGHQGPLRRVDDRCVGELRPLHDVCLLQALEERRVEGARGRDGLVELDVLPREVLQVQDGVLLELELLAQL